ncbi:CubicO group peptidase (beta-lactamase class C family) [Streptomyces canus]
MSAHTPSRRHRVPRGALTLALATCLGAALVSCSDEGQGGTELAAGQGTAHTAAAGRLSVLTQKAADTGSLGVIVRIDRADGKPVEIARQAAWTKDDHRLAVGDRFRVGSNTKTLTATLVLQQVAEKSIGLDDTVEKWLPGLVKGGEHITVRMLLNHTSGLGDFLLTPEFLPSLTGQEQRTWKPEELLAVTPEQDPPTEPGKKYSYSNANYEALGLILEKATGSSLAELVEQRITKPLGMKDSFLATDAAWPAGKRHATGYEPDAERLKALLSGDRGPARGRRIRRARTPRGQHRHRCHRPELVVGGRRYGLHRAGLAALPHGAHVRTVAARGPDEADARHRGRPRGRRSVRSGPDEGGHALRHGLGSHRRPARLLQ